MIEWALIIWLYLAGACLLEYGTMDAYETWRTKKGHGPINKKVRACLVALWPIPCGLAACYILFRSLIGRS